MTETLRESNRVFAELLHGISKIMTDLGNNFCRARNANSGCDNAKPTSAPCSSEHVFPESTVSAPLPSNLFLLAVTLLVTAVWQILPVRISLILNQKIKKHIHIFQFAVKLSYIDIKWQDIYFTFLKTFFYIYLRSTIMYNWGNTLKHNVVIL